MTTAHRPGSLHQRNKHFKSRHSSKSQIKTRNKGKVPASGHQHATTVGHQPTRLDRKNAAKLEREKIKAQRLMEHRFFGNGHSSKVPKIVAVVALSQDICVRQVVESLQDDDDGASCAMMVQNDQDQERHARIVHQGQTLLMVECERPGVSTESSSAAAGEGNNGEDKDNLGEYFMNTLRAAQSADYILVVASAREEVDALGESLLEAMAAQGSSNVVIAIAVGFTV